VRRAILFLAISVLCMGSIASADSFSFYTDRVSMNPTDSFDWGQLGAPGTFIDTPAAVFSSGATNAALVGNADGSQFLTMQQGVTWNGNFAFGENLVWTGNANFGVGGLGPFLVELLNPVGSIGFGIQADLYGPFTAYVDLYDSNYSYLASFSFTGNSSSSNAGDNLFIGIRDISAVNIGAMVIQTDSGDPDFANDFAINSVSFDYQPPVPEPGTLAMLGSALLGAAGLIRSKIGR